MSGSVRLHAVNPANLDRLSFVALLLTFHRRRGTPVTSPPSILGRPLNVHALYLLARYRGGFHHLQDSSQWREVAVCLVPESHVDFATGILPRLYFHLLLPFEFFLENQSLPISPPSSTKSSTLAASNPPSPPSHTASSASLSFILNVAPSSPAPGNRHVPPPPHIPYEEKDPQGSRMDRPHLRTTDPARAKHSTASSSVVGFGDLKDDTLAHIFRIVGSRGNVRDVTRLCLVCRRFRVVVITHPSSAADARIPADLCIPRTASSLINLCRSAATNGVASAQYLLSFLLFAGWAGAHRSNDAALHWATLAASRGHPHAPQLAAAIRTELGRSNGRCPEATQAISIPVPSYSGTSSRFLDTVCSSRTAH